MYDRYGTLECTSCKLEKDYIYNAVLHNATFYIASAIFLGIAGRSSSFWKWIVLLSCLALEYTWLIHPDPLEYLFSTIPPFQKIEILHTLSWSLSMALSQLAPPSPRSLTKIIEDVSTANHDLELETASTLAPIAGAFKDPRDLRVLHQNLLAKSRFDDLVDRPVVQDAIVNARN